MSETRLYIEGPIAVGSEAEIRDEQARYVGRVLRLKPGDCVTLFDGTGPEYSASIVSLGKTRVLVSVSDEIRRDAESPLRIHLLQGISRGERMDFVVQKATELGVHRITPVMTEYSVVKLDKKRAEKRIRHWHGIAASACEQCGRNVLPALDSPIALRNWLGENQNSTGMRIILKPGAEGSLKSIQPDDSQLIALIGPEGGFSDEEYELAETTGFNAVGFGPRILRTETAALAVVAAVQALSGDLAPG